MMEEEKTRLLALLAQPAAWCREAEARDADGQAVRFDDESAVAWDITGALCHLFGWQRACVLFQQIERHLIGKRPPGGYPVSDPNIVAMKTLQEFNDRSDTTFQTVRDRLEAMPIWHNGNRADDGAIDS